MGFEAAHAAETARIISDLPLEYVINSVHYWQPVHDGSEWERGRKTVYREYLEAVAASLDAPYEFSTVGHLGYPERYAPYPENDRVFKYGEFRKLFDDIIKKAVCRGARLEENTNGGGELKLPRADLLQAYKAAGGKRPVTASDAHTIGAIGQRFKEAETFLDGIFGNE